MERKFKSLFRRIILPFHKLVFYSFRKKQLDCNRKGEQLKIGISAVVAMKNEEYTLPFCLKSLIGFADQVIIIDNGSEDNSLKKAMEFKSKYGKLIEIKIIEMPGALLGDCREEGLKHTDYQWHLRWDADMVAHSDGEFDIKKLRIKVLQDNTPRTIQLPRINLTGDLFHVSRNKDWDEGEPILMWFNKDIYYKEYGKFDTIRVPKYYKQIKETVNYYFHCQGLKSITNLIHRFHYFKWREKVNQLKANEISNNLLNYDIFVQNRNKYLFGTNNELSVKYRYSIQVVNSFVKLDLKKFGEYPIVLREEIKNENARFFVQYKNDKPFRRIDLNDLELMNYIPSEDDLNWIQDDFFSKLSTEDKFLLI